MQELLTDRPPIISLQHDFELGRANTKIRWTPPEVFTKAQSAPAFLIQAHLQRWDHHQSSPRYLRHASVFARFHPRDRAVCPHGKLIQWVEMARDPRHRAVTLIQLNDPNNTGKLCVGNKIKRQRVREFGISCSLCLRFRLCNYSDALSHTQAFQTRSP